MTGILIDPDSSGIEMINNMLNIKSQITIVEFYFDGRILFRPLQSRRFQFQLFAYGIFSDDLNKISSRDKTGR
jgi:hypothetical protein